MRYGLLFLLCWWPLQSHALTWEDWWQTPDQQAARQLAQGEAQAAAETFHDPAWQAIADYRAGNYAQAAKAFAQENTAVGHFNQGNALVHAGDYPSALAAYQQALTLQPDFADAQFNLARLKEWLAQQPNNPAPSDAKSETSQSSAPDSSSTPNANPAESSPSADGSSQSDPATANPASQAGDDGNEAEQHPDSAGSPSGETQPESPSQRDASSDAESTAAKASAEQADNRKTPAEAPAESSSTDSKETTAGADTAASPTGDQSGTATRDAKNSEQQQSMQQWLQQVPDDPGGLLKQKFLRDYQRQQQAMSSS